MLGPLQADDRGSPLEVIDVREPFWEGPVVVADRILDQGRAHQGLGNEQAPERPLPDVVRQAPRGAERRSRPVDRPISVLRVSVDRRDTGPALIPPGVWHADQNMAEEDVVRITFRPARTIRISRTSIESTSPGPIPVRLVAEALSTGRG